MSKKIVMILFLITLNLLLLGSTTVFAAYTRVRGGICTHTSVTAPTCTKTGYCVYDGTLKALGHNVNDWSNVTASGHEGRCSRCGLTVIESHIKDGNATCTKPSKCTECDYIIQKALGHNYSEATCTKAKICTRCGATTGSALGHSYKKEPINANWHSVICERCGFSSGPEKHNFSNNECLQCGYTKNEVHTHKIAIAATCTTAAKCSCGETIGNPLGHAYVYTKVDVRTHKITCSRCSNVNSVAIHIFSNNKCKLCGYVRPTEIIVDGENCSHNYTWLVEELPTCTTDGTRAYKCTKCGKISNTQVLKATGHKNFTYIEKDDTYHEVVCTVCGETVATAVHTFSDNVCTSCGYIKNSKIGEVKISGKLVYAPGEEGSITATFPSKDAGATTIWTSDRPDVIEKLRQNYPEGLKSIGYVKIAKDVKEITTVHCTVENSGYVGKFDIIVSPKVESISFVEDNISIILDNNEDVSSITRKLEVKFEPEGTTSDLKWISSNTRVAKVENGILTIVGNGKATITATTSNYKKATCIVTVSIPTQNMTLDKTELTFMHDGQKVVGSPKTYTLKATIEPKGVNTVTTWASSDENVATVDKNGKVTPTGIGTCTITATNGSKSATCTVAVTAAMNIFRLNKENISLEIEDVKGDVTEQLEAIFEPEGTKSQITWSSNNKSLAEVDSNGLVTIKLGSYNKASGKATITAKATNGNGRQISQTCVITVSVPTQNIILSKTELTFMHDGQKAVGSLKTYTLKATIEPNGVSTVTTWASSDENVATVDKNGKVTPIGIGTCTITATNGSKSATCTVEVTAAMNTFRLNKKNISLEIEDVKGDVTEQLEAIFEPEGSKSQITWSSNNKSLAEVDGNGLVTIKLSTYNKASGKATITAKATNGNGKQISQTCVITVSVPTQNITLSKTELSFMHDGQKVVGPTKTYTLKATIEPNGVSTVTTWASSDENVATVDKNGKVTPTGIGTCTITATNGSKSAECNVIVTPAVNSISITPNKIEFIYENKVEISNLQKELTIVYNPVDAYSEITWKSNNEKIAKVDANGIVTAVGNGTTTIVAQTKNANGATIKAECPVSVSVPTQSITLDKNEVTLIYDATKPKQETQKITITQIVPNNVTTPTEWSIEGDSDIISMKIDKKGTTVTISPLKVGECVINATNAGVVASCKVIVNKSNIDTVYKNHMSYSVSPVQKESEEKKVIVLYAGSGEIAKATERYKIEEPNCTIIVLQPNNGSGGAGEVWNDNVLDETCAIIQEYKNAGYSIELLAHSQGGYGAIETAKKLDLDENDKVVLAEATMNGSSSNVSDYKEVLDKGVSLEIYIGSNSDKQNIKNRAQACDKAFTGVYDNFTYKKVSGENHGTIILDFIEEIGENQGDYYKNFKR